MSVGQGLEWRRLRVIEKEAQELAAAKEELEKLDKVKSQLMLTVAHELRAPVAAVQSYVNLILSGYVAQSEMNATLSRVQERLQEMLDMIANILELAQLRQTHLKEIQRVLTSEAQPLDMAAVLEEVHELLKDQASQKQQSFEVSILDRPVLVAEREHLKRVWINLISNAIKYTPEGGHIAVRLQTDRDNVVGVVEDSGIGISKRDQAKLFQDFFRTDEAKASGEIGTGLGLSIVKQIIDMYQGQIEVTSVPGQGSRFTFVLPLEPIPKDPSRNTAAGDVPHARDSIQSSARSAGNAESFILGGDTSLTPTT
jgi:signal transduction histidine kinase